MVDPNDIDSGYDTFNANKDVADAAFKRKLADMRERRARRARASGDDLINNDEYQRKMNEFAGPGRVNESQQNIDQRRLNARYQADQWRQQEAKRRLDAMAGFSDEERAKVSPEFDAPGSRVTMGGRTLSMPGEKRREFNMDAFSTIAARKLKEKEADDRWWADELAATARLSAKQEKQAEHDRAIALLREKAALAAATPEGKVASAQAAAIQAQLEEAKAERDRMRESLGGLRARINDPDELAALNATPESQQGSVAQGFIDKREEKRAGRISTAKGMLADGDPTNDDEALGVIKNEGKPNEQVGVSKPTYSIDGILESKTNIGRQLSSARDNLVREASKYTGFFDKAKDRSPFIAKVDQYRAALEKLGISPEEVEQHIASLGIPTSAGGGFMRKALTPGFGLLPVDEVFDGVFGK